MRTVRACSFILAVLCFLAQPNAPAQDCKPKVTIAPDGTLLKDDCSGTKKVVSPDQGAATSAAAAPCATGTVPLNGDCVDPASKAAYDKALAAKYEYEAFSYEHARRAFQQQEHTSIGVFWIVVVMVLAGLAFSAIQFYMGFRHSHVALARKTKGLPEPTADRTDIEASLKGIKVSSTMLGVLVLVISMAFFYLYLAIVYPITNVSGK